MKRREFIKLITAAGFAVTAKADGRARGLALLAPHKITSACPLVIYHHGSNETERSIVNFVDGKSTIVPALQSAGYIVAASNAHGNNWGNQASLDDYANLYGFLEGQQISDKVLFLAQSMGGLSALLSIVEGRISNVKGFYGIYPCTNLANNYAQGALVGGINAAYSISGGNPYATATAGHDPNLIDAGDFPNIRYRASASYSDTLVPRADNWDLMATKLSGKLEASTLDATGDHGNSSHFNSTDVLDFYSRC
jgi:hypothetical protein